MSDHTTFILRAYVCDNGGLYYCGDEGASTLKDIFLRRPDKCRYAIVRSTHINEYLAIDMFELLTSDGSDVMAGKFATYRTEAAAVAATQLTY